MTDLTTHPDPIEHESCSRCGCCSTDWVECWKCGGEGLDGHDCGEDCCCCLAPEDNVHCDACDGKGGWWECAGRCDSRGKHRGPASEVLL